MVAYEESWMVDKVMMRFGGSFVEHLGEALIRADLDNRHRIYQAFPEYWQKYLKLAIDNKLDQEIK